MCLWTRKRAKPGAGWGLWEECLVDEREHVMQVERTCLGKVLLTGCLLVLGAAVNTNGYTRNFEFGPWSSSQSVQLLSAHGMVSVERSTCDVREYLTNWSQDWSQVHRLEVLSYEAGKQVLIGHPSQVYLVVQDRIWGIAAQGRTLRIATSTRLQDDLGAKDLFVRDFMQRFVEEPNVEAWGDVAIWRIALRRIFNSSKLTTSMDAHKNDVVSISGTKVDRDGVTLTMQSDAGRILSITLGPEGELLRAGCDGKDLPIVLDCRLPWNEPHGFGGLGGASVVGPFGAVPAFSLSQDYTIVDEAGEERNVGGVTTVVLEGTGHLVFGPFDARYAFVNGQLIAVKVLDGNELCVFRGASRRIPLSPAGVSVFREEAVRFESEFEANKHEWKVDSIAKLAGLLGEEPGFSSTTTFQVHPTGLSVRGDSLLIKVRSSDNRVGEVVLRPDLSVAASRPVED